MTKLSIEVIPPKEEIELKQACEQLRQFKNLNPSFISVTRRAEGDFQCTIDTSSFIQCELSIPALAHIAAIQFPQEAVSSFVEGLQQASVQRLLVVRGDGDGLKRETFNESLNLMRALRENNFVGEIAVAAMPEGYPGENNHEGVRKAVAILKAKQNQGASFAITQLFLSIDKYEKFLEECVLQGVHLPILPGIMNIANSKRLTRMQSLTGMELPLEIRTIVEKYGEDKESFKQAGTQYILKLCQDLIDLKVPGIHLFSFNNISEIELIIKAFS